MNNKFKCSQYQETEKPSLGVAESAGYGSVRLETDMEIHRPANREQEITEAAHSNDSGRYCKFALQNRPSILNHILISCP